MAMSEAADAIVQARLENGSWAGWSDVLIRVDGESRFGKWRYEPVETKLARETRGATLIQLCLYGELLAELQGSAPEFLRVVVPDADFVAERYREEHLPKDAGPGAVAIRRPTLGSDWRALRWRTVVWCLGR